MQDAIMDSLGKLAAPLGIALGIVMVAYLVPRVLLITFAAVHIVLHTCRIVRCAPPEANLGEVVRSVFIECYKQRKVVKKSRKA